MIGNEEIVGALTQFKSNTDYGVFYQFKSGMCCTKKWCCFCEKNRGIYQERRDTLVDGFRTFGWNVDKPAGSMFVWAEIPKGWTSIDFAYALMDRANVVVTPVMHLDLTEKALYVLHSFKIKKCYNKLLKTLEIVVFFS